MSLIDYPPSLSHDPFVSTSPSARTCVWSTCTLQTWFTAPQCRNSFTTPYSSYDITHPHPRPVAVADVTAVSFPYTVAYQFNTRVRVTYLCSYVSARINIRSCLTQRVTQVGIHSRVLCLRSRLKFIFSVTLRERARMKRSVHLKMNSRLF